MARIKRRRRVRCRLPGEVLQRSRNVQASVLTISEGGFSVEVGLRLDQGEPITLLILPRRGRQEVEVQGLVWNRRRSARTRNGEKLLVLGCQVLAPPSSFFELLDRLEGPKRRPPGRPPPSRAPNAAPLPEVEADLPRSRELQPPHKPEPEESLPTFRIRLKHVDGPRTRTVKLRARSLAQAEERIHTDIAEDGTWEVLEIRRGS